MPQTSLSSDKVILRRRQRRRVPRRLRRRWPKPRLTFRLILQWSDEFHRLKGRWPHNFAGHIKWAGEDTWSRMNDALAQGNRGLKGGSSLAKLLYIHRGVRSPRNVPTLNEEQIFRWAQAHFKRTGRWPRGNSGKVTGAPGETWAAIDIALTRGKRGLPGGSSVAQLLARRGVKRNPQGLPPFSVNEVLLLADQFFKSRGHWPYRNSGPIDGLPSETWMAIDKALQRGSRGLPAGWTLSSFPNTHRGIYGGRSRRSRRIRESKHLSMEQIVAWGKSHFRRHRIYPNRDTGQIAGSGGLKWSTVDSALKSGSRGLPGGCSLARLFGSRRVRKMGRATEAICNSYTNGR